MLWYPFMRSMRDRSLHAVLAFSAGILAFLAFDTGFEALEVAEEVPGVFEGPLLVVLGAIGALLAVQAVVDLFEADGEASDAAATDGGDESGDEVDGSGAGAGGSGSVGGRPAPLAVAYAAALAIGLHNLAEGLAIGGAFALGRASLGAFLVVGFMVHNVTEGPVVVAPLAREDRPALWHFAALGVLAGAPVVLGGWLGNAFQSPVLGALFLAVGVGALAQVVWDVAAIVGREGEITAWHNLAGFGVGLAVMYLTDLLVVL
jgi:zinc transporter ZupT